MQVRLSQNEVAQLLEVVDDTYSSCVALGARCCLGANARLPRIH